MNELTPMHLALLDLGLEDQIPLPEAVGSMRFEGLIGAEESVAKISRALVDLLRKGLIQLWSGHWPEEPKPVKFERALSMLSDYRRYSFEAEATGLERVYYVNVDNLHFSEDE